MVHEMGNTFKNLGHLKAVSELEEEMEGNTSQIHSPLKPFFLLKFHNTFLSLWTFWLKQWVLAVVL